MSTRESNEKSSRRSRNWVFIVYPDSAPEDWRTIIDDYHVEWVESPLHDRDVNPTGEQKKPHYHVLVMFSGLKSYDQVKEISDSVNAPRPFICQNLRSMVRYFAHLDNPEKAQYSYTDILVHGGADLSDLVKPTSTERYKYIAEMMDFVDENEISEFYVLLQFARLEHMDDWFPLLCDSCSYVVKAYVDSKRYHKEDDLKHELNQKIYDYDKLKEKFIELKKSTSELKKSTS